MRLRPAVVATAIVALLSASVSQPASAATVLFEDRFDVDDGLITNSFATHNPDRADAVASPDWTMSMGSLFARSSAAWSGAPDEHSPDAASATTTGSSIFCLTTKRADFGDVSVSMRVRPEYLVSTPTLPALATDGVHIWLRKLNDQTLYAVSVLRRDGHVTIKKKCPIGDANDGTYYTLAESTGLSIPMNEWSTVEADAVNVIGGVRLRLRIDGVVALQADDIGVTGCIPLLLPGAVGVRGDNTAFSFDDFVVTSSS